MKSIHDKESEKLTLDIEAFLANGGKVKQAKPETSLEVKILFIQSRGDITQNQKDFKIKKMREGRHDQ